MHIWKYLENLSLVAFMLEKLFLADGKCCLCCFINDAASSLQIKDAANVLECLTA